MKTAISIPDAVFDEAEEMVSRLGISRSELYTRAVAAFVREHRRKGITESLNRIYPKQAKGLDPVLARMQFLSLPREDW